jgi:aryl-alcohol dehydrogenase-like predicted oxidoreductase
MLYTTMPNTTLTPSALCLGTNMMGSVQDEKTSFVLLDAFLDAGGTFLDTAKVYADWLPGERSVSEKTLGKWLHARGTRDRVVLATKGAHPDLNAMHIGRLGRTDIVADVEASLRHLQTNVIDLYWLHRDDNTRPVYEIVQTLEDLVRAGKIRYYGCSNWRAPRIAEAQALARDQGWAGFVADQMMWSLAAVDPATLPDPTMVAMDQALKEYHLATGLAAVPYSAQANGYFQKLASGEGRRVSKGQEGIYGSRTNTARLARVRQLAVESGLSITGIVLGYLLAQPFPTFPIFGSRTLAQLNDVLGAADVILTQAQIAFLEQG